MKITGSGGIDWTILLHVLVSPKTRKEQESDPFFSQKKGDFLLSHGKTLAPKERPTFDHRVENERKI